MYDQNVLYLDTLSAARLELRLNGEGRVSLWLRWPLLKAVLDSRVVSIKGEALLGEEKERPTFLQIQVKYCDVSPL